MSPEPTSRRTPAAGGQDACDRCLALSYLTVVLCKVPRPQGRQDDEESGGGVRDAPPPAPPSFADVAPVPSELIHLVDGVTPQRATQSAGRLGEWSADAVRADCSEHDVTATCQCSTDYPFPLRALADPPPVLFLRGHAAVLDACDQDAVGRVGTRRPTRLGRDATRQLAAGVARGGEVVVSGMALGVDAAAHAGALDVGGLTVAVLAGGVERASPSSHRRLYEAILDAGVVVSEFAPGNHPDLWTFPARNRIIAALSRVVAVIEAPRRSGALITAEQASDLGKQVYALPGSTASETSEGTNRLLKDGARVVLEAADLLRVRGLDGPAPVSPGEGTAGVVHAALARGAASPSELVRRSPGLSQGEVELALLDLELSGWIARRPDGRYRVEDRWAP